MKRAFGATGAALIACLLFIIVTSAGVISSTSEEAAAAPISEGAVCTVTVDGEGLTLSGVQLGNAATIQKVGASKGVPERGLVVSIATAMQESKIKNLASRAVPESMSYPNDDVAAGDHDSVGIFQERRAWWNGSVANGMNVEYSARQFFGGADDTPNIPGLLDINGWQSMSIAQAAQAVQVSAFPDAYAQWEGLARAVVDGSSVSCQDGSGTTSGAWTAPLKPGTYSITSDFGPRACNGCTTFHKGVDLGAPTGTPVYAAAKGTVIFAGVMGTYGNMIEVDHGGGVTTRHAHLSRIIATDGTPVEPGQLIGEVGNTGNSFGAHLHFETRIKATPVDPVPFLRQKGVTL